MPKMLRVAVEGCGALRGGFGMGDNHTFFEGIKIISDAERSEKLYSGCVGAFYIFHGGSFVCSVKSIGAGID